MLSIIIPTLNEEKYLPSLLDSIKNQSFKNYEIIVSDAGSKDKTREIAKRYGAKIVDGGLPAKGRNEGAKVARGDLLLFLDADVLLSEKFLEKSLKEFKEKKLKVASFLIAPQRKSKILKILFFLFYNLPWLFFEKIFPHGAMAILVEKEIFQKVGGFDETLKVAEDHHFIQKAAKLGKFALIRSTKILISTRRFEKEGWVKLYLKYILIELHMIFLGPVKTDIFKYRFGGDEEKSKNNFN
jgi:glycosyltransferase involved in cell wall biosynthesis